MNLVQRLRNRLGQRVAILTVGRPDRGDDAAGCRVAERLRAMLPEHAAVALFDGQDVPETLIGLIAAWQPDSVLLVDAVDFGREPSAVALLEREHLYPYVPSTHRFPLNLLMHILELETGADVLLFAIQPRQIRLGSSMSPEVEAGADLVASILCQALPRSAAPKAERCHQPEEETHS
jgi:hydrogenase 3 maturation protease